MRVKSSTIIIALYFFNMIVIPNGSVFSRLLKIIFVGLSFSYILLKHKTLKWYDHFTWMIAFMLLSFISIYWATSRDYAIQGTKTIALNTLCVIMLGMILMNNKNWKEIVIPCICIFPAVLFLRLMFMHGLAVFGGLRNIEGGMHNASGMYAGIGIAFSIYYILEHYPKGYSEKRLMWIIILCLNVIVCVFSMSRKAIIYVGLPLIFGLLFSGKNVSKKIKNLIVMIVITIMIYVLLTRVPMLYNYVGKGIQNALTYLLTGVGDTSAAGRNTRILFGLKMLKSKPWLGYGAMNYNYHFNNFESITQMIVADNNYIDVIVNQGIVGIVLYYSIYLRYIVRFITKGSHDTFVEVFPFAVLLTLLVADYGVSSYLYLHSQTYLMLATLLIYQMTLRIKHKNL